MIILANKTWGGFCHTDEFVEHFGLENGWDEIDFDTRDNPEYINFYHHHDRGDIGFCYVPDDATDWDIMEYDGKEWVVYVHNGKLNYSYPE